MTCAFFECILMIIFSFNVVEEKIMPQDNQPQNDNKQHQPAIVVNSQYIKDFSLEIPYAPEIFKEIKKNPDVHVDVEVNTRALEENYHNVDLSFTINGDTEDKKFFIIELTYSAVVQLNVPQEHVEPVLMVEIPRLLFPFARQVITTSLTEAGLPPFMLNPIDFALLYQTKKQSVHGKN